MPYALSAEERSILRQLATSQAHIAALPIQQVRRSLWAGVNDNRPGARPPFAIESWTFARDFMPESLLRCTSDFGRNLERGFLYNIRHHELLGDDHVCPSSLDMGWHVWHDEFGVEIPTQYIKDSEGIVTGYHFDCPVKDLTQGFDMIKPARFGVNRESTHEEFVFLNEIFGDILPVVIRSSTYGNNNLTQRLMRICPQEGMFLGMYDAPEQLHALLALLRDNAKRMAQWAEAEGLLELNNQNQCTCGTCYNFTDTFPTSKPPRGQVRLKDMWSVMDSQETVGVKPKLFHEFFFPYYRDLAELYGQIYWGCCEPVDPIWENSISKLPNLKSVSISRWANQTKMGELLDRTGIVYSRKPNPNLLGVDRVLNEDAWAAEIRSTLTALHGKQVPLEFVVRDVYSMHGNLDKARRAVEIARNEIDAVYGPLEQAVAAV